MDKYIQTFAFVDSLCELLGTRAYLWGGWIPDIYSGKLLRQHDDCEHLVLNLYDYLERIQEVFNLLGWETKVLENGDLKVKKDHIKIHFGHLTKKNGTAEWYHNGKLGKIVFPETWLNSDNIVFSGKALHAVKPEFQLVLKLHPEFMNPVWKHREKDKHDIEVLRTLLNRYYVAFQYYRIPTPLIMPN